MLSLSFYPEEVLAERMPDGSACGPDMEYAAEFVVFRSLATPEEERQVGDSVLAARDPEWGEVLKVGRQLLTKTCDVRVLVPTMCAAVHRHGLPALAEGLAVLADWLGQRWEDIHPRLAVDGEFDPLLRSNAVAELADSGGLMRAIRAATLLATPMGRVAVNDAEKLLKGAVLSDAALVRTLDGLHEAIAQEAQRNADAFLAVEQACQSVADIQQRYQQHGLDIEYVPDLRPLAELLQGIFDCLPGQAVAGALKSDSLQLQGSAVGQQDERAACATPATTGLPTTIGSRSEAYRALGLARRFFEEHEPSHPAILLIRRIEELQGKDFLSLVQELTPDGLAQLRVLVGRAEE